MMNRNRNEGSCRLLQGTVCDQWRRSDADRLPARAPGTRTAPGREDRAALGRTAGVLAAIAALGLAGMAQGAIAISFADPIPGRQLHNEANGGGAGFGRLTYDIATPIQFLFDGSDESLPTHVFVNARMEMNMTIGAATTVAGITIAPVAGFFRIMDASSEGSADIITGTVSEGAFVRIDNTNSMLFSDPDLIYVPGPALTAITGPLGFIEPSEAVFTLTSVHTVDGSFFINPDGTFQTFDANASFSGNMGVPAPGAMALGMLGALCLVATRRRF
ncbi:hypothetical protein PHYC_01869 [Phycisphaerales bacterium]|nr:hypothetical protein PHYC_01869 [Phycisphaerales bacterium]